MISLKTLVESTILDELKVKNLSKEKDSEYKYFLAFRQHLFIMDSTSNIKKVRSALSKHPAIRKKKNRYDDNSFEFIRTVGEEAPDILMGQWYPEDKALRVWSGQEVIPQTSLQVKKVAKQLGVKTVTYQYYDYIGRDLNAARNILRVGMDSFSNAS